MLSGVLKSDRAVKVNVTIVRTFVRLRQMLASHEDLSRKVEQHDEDRHSVGARSGLPRS